MPLIYKILYSIILLLLLGFCLGIHSAMQPGEYGYLQLASSIIKTPFLLLSSTTIAIFVVFSVDIAIGSSVGLKNIVEAAASCLLFTSIAAIPLCAAVLVFALLENYSLLILTVYSGLSLAGIIGVYGFAHALRAHPPLLSSRTLIALTVTWMISFGATNAEIGWKVRPLVGWTGQSFAFFRHDDVGMSDQIRCELRNTFNFGGIKFPKREEASDTKQWPC